VLECLCDMESPSCEDRGPETTGRTSEEGPEPGSRMSRVTRAGHGYYKRECGCVDAQMGEVGKWANAMVNEGERG
jgi:hypothetical protein